MNDLITLKLCVCNQHKCHTICVVMNNYRTYISHFIQKFENEMKMYQNDIETLMNILLFYVSFIPKTV